MQARRRRLCRLHLAQELRRLADGSHTFVVKARDAAGNSSAETSFSWTIDTVAPTTTITGKPANPSNTSAPSFAFTASESGSTFLCRIDAQAFSACDSPKSYASLGQGAHTFGVKATDRAGNAGAEATYTWTVDTVDPTTSITGQPANPINASSATFAFTANESGSTFACRLDGAAFAPCASPKSYTGLGDGQHTFAVRATDPAGNQGLPDTLPVEDRHHAADDCDHGQAREPDQRKLCELLVRGQRAGSSFSCRIDTAAFAGCTSPKSYAGLTDGAHTFSVRATDALGNVGPVTSYTWTIDTVAPSVQITQKPNSPSNASSPSFSFTASEAGSTFACRLEQGGVRALHGAEELRPARGRRSTRSPSRRPTSPATPGPRRPTPGRSTRSRPTATITRQAEQPEQQPARPSFAFIGERGQHLRLPPRRRRLSRRARPRGLQPASPTDHIRSPSEQPTLPGNTGPETTYAWTIETRAPTAALVSAPAGLSNSSAGDLRVLGRRALVVRLQRGRARLRALQLARDVSRARRRRARLQRSGQGCGRQPQRPGWTFVGDRHDRSGDDARRSADLRDGDLGDLRVSRRARARRSSAGSTAHRSRCAARRRATAA